MKNDLKKQFKQQQKKEKAKSILKWVACGVGWTSLLGLFIALLCLGVKGCNNKKQQQASASTIIGDYSVNNKAVIGEEVYKYYYRYYNDIDDFESATSSSSQDYDLYLHLKIVSNDIEGSNGFYYTANKISLSVSTLEVGSSLSRYITLRAYSNSDNPSMLTLYQKVMLDDEVQSITNNIQVGFLECDNDLSLADYNNNALGFLADLVKVNAVVNLDYRFDFNSQINRYGIIGQSNTYFGLEGSYLGTSWVIKGYFKDELDNYYTGIRICYAQADGVGYVDGSYKIFDQNGVMFLYLEYVKANGSTVIVNSANYIQYDNKTSYTNSSKWLSDTFRHLTIFYFDEVQNPTLPIGHYSPLEVLNSFNNDTLSFSPIGNDDGVFGLLGSAFGSIASILGMQVIPGITIGLLIFIPFSITILLTCVWLFKR